MLAMPSTAGPGPESSFEAPLIGLDGRGIDLNMAFNYNSQLWHKSGSDMYFDIDRDWIAGWIMGFGKIVMAGTSYIMIDADGTRHPYSGLSRGSFPSPYSSLQTYEAYTTDGSFINYYAEGYKAQFDNSGGHNMRFAWAKLANGTTIEYGAPPTMRSTRRRSPMPTATASPSPIAPTHVTGTTSGSTGSRKGQISKQSPTRSVGLFSFITSDRVRRPTRRIC
ncbi:MAG: hypothetical protein IPJ07_04755 [Acidobacteria bacterium]|nr:hypothetical protein [Acidobacteriota bacterium]